MAYRYCLMVYVMVGLWCVGAPALGAAVGGGEPSPTAVPQAWTYAEAMQQLQYNPGDVYLQYVVLQLGRNEGKAEEAYQAIERLNPRRRWDNDRRVDLFATFTGALAVQESLQLDTMRPDGSVRGASGDRGNPRRKPAARAEDSTLKVAELQGPTVKSHPWDKMLAAQQVAGKAPKISPLALCVPQDQYLILFRSLTKLLEGVDVGDVWGGHLYNQAAKTATSQETSERLKTQLAVKTDLLTRPFYDVVVEEVAVTGSDLFFREGSDVTVLFSVKQPEVFRARMDGFLATAEKSRPDAVRSTGRLEGVEYVAITTPDRAIHAFSAYPKPNLHVRSNSRAALQRVLRAMAGKPDVPRLGDTTEMKYIRTLMVAGDPREDGLIYLSDPFIRRLVGPELKLTERRRLLCYNHLRMIGHAVMLYRTQYGKAPESLEQVTQGRCAPGKFGEGELRCPDGGKYGLTADGCGGTCSHHGHAQQLVPCLEIPVEQVTAEEADEYRRFVDEYSRYWQRFFDPIAVRVQMTAERYRAETIILPLIDNSIYTGLGGVLGGEPEALDALPVPQRNIFSVAVRLNKEGLLKDHRPTLRGLLVDLPRSVQIAGPAESSVEQFLTRGIGNQIGMHVYDSSPFVDFDLTGFLGEVLRGFGRNPGRLDNDMIPIAFLVSSLNAPVYLSIPVKDEKVVDDFLKELDASLAGLARQRQWRGWFGLGYDFYRIPQAGKDPQTYCMGIEFGPVKWRLFFARIGGGLYIASKAFILDDLAAMHERADRPDRKQADQGPIAHAMVRVRPEHWKEVLPEFQLGWEESAREACLDNLGPLSSVARSMSAAGKPVATEQVQKQASALHAVRFFCPDGGKYELLAGGKQMSCSIHGTAAAPQQRSAPDPRSPIGRLLRDFGGATAELTFLEDGLHAVVTIDRK